MPTKKPAHPAPGRPQRQPTMAELEFLSRASLECRSWQEIATELKVDWAVVRRWHDQWVKPLWQAAVGKHAHEEIARLNLIEKFCWQQVHSQTREFPDLPALGFTAKQAKLVKALFPHGKAANPGLAWLGLILSVIDMRCKIRGDYAPAKLAATIETGPRVAGSTPAVEADKMLKKLIDTIEERRSFEAVLKAAQGSNN